MKWEEIGHDKWQTQAKNRSIWRKFIKLCQNHETPRLTANIIRYRSVANILRPPTTTMMCPLHLFHDCYSGSCSSDLRSCMPHPVKHYAFKHFLPFILPDTVIATTSRLCARHRPPEISPSTSKKKWSKGIPTASASPVTEDLLRQRALPHSTTGARERGHNCDPEEWLACRKNAWRHLVRLYIRNSNSAGLNFCFIPSRSIK